jgi:RNA polymerase sigma factor (sigma-70 family)
MTKYMTIESSKKYSTSEEKAAALGVSKKRFRMIEKLVRNIRALDLSSSIDTYGKLASNIEAVDYSDPEKIVLGQIEHEELSVLLDRLSEREKFIIRVRYGFEDGVPRTLAETGKLIHVSRERVRQLEMRALRKLKSLLEHDMTESNQ